MKVFWAWQADIEGKIARHLVREALEEAIDKLKQPRDIEEPPEESRRNDLHLDHDTKGLRGSPEIAHEIFKKIDASTVLVADVTPVGTVPSGKPLMNPNVAIELGYAFGKLGTDCFLPVLNLAYGDERTLPFDILRRRHPVTFDLKESATTAEIKLAKKGLVDQFVRALEPYLADPTAYMWDYDEEGAHVLIDIGNESRKVISHAGRNGFLYTMERANGQSLMAKPYVPLVTWTAGIDQKTGLPVDYDPKRDIQVYSGRQNQTPADPVKRQCPWLGGGNNYWPPS